MHQLGQNAIEADAHGQGAFPRFDMDVAGPRLDGIDEKILDQRANFDPALAGFGLKVFESLAHRAELPNSMANVTTNFSAAARAEDQSRPSQLAGVQGGGIRQRGLSLKNN